MGAAPHCVLEPRHNHFLLQFYIERRVIEQFGVFGSEKRALFAVGVAVVAFYDIVEHRAVVDLLAPCRQFVVAASGTYFGVGIDKYLQLGVGKHYRAYIASVHHYALGSPHLLLPTNHLLPHKIDGTHPAGSVAHLQSTYPVLYVDPVEEGMLLVADVSECDAEVAYLSP